MKTPEQKREDRKEKLIRKAQKRKIRDFYYKGSGGPIRKLGLTLKRTQDKVLEKLK